MSSSLLCLQWGSHKTVLTCKLNNLRSEGTFCDATLSCLEKDFPVHRLVLSSCSEYFEGIFRKTPCRHPFIILKDVDATTLEFIIEFMYKGDVKLPEDQLESFIKTSESLKIKGLAASEDIPMTDSERNELPYESQTDSQNEMHSFPSRIEETATPLEISSLNPIESIYITDNSLLKKTSQQKPETSLNAESGDKQNFQDINLGHQTTEGTVIKTSPGASSKKRENSEISQKQTNDKTVKKKTGKKTNKREGPERIHLHECTVTFIGKEEEQEETSPGIGWNMQRLRSQTQQQSNTSESEEHQTQLENIIDETMLDSQMKVEVEEFMDDPSEDSQAETPSDVPTPPHNAFGFRTTEEFKHSTSILETDEDDMDDPTPTHWENEENGMISSSEATTSAAAIQPNVSNVEQHALNAVRPLAVQSAEEIEKPFACYICPYRTKYRNALVGHVVLHSGVKPYKCSMCSYASSRPTHLKIHARVHTKEKPFKCEVCSKEFAQKANYKIHMWIHSKCKPFKCHFCTFSTNNNHSLKRHIRIHEGKVPYKCTLCPYGAQAMTDLKKHLRTHTGEKPFACPHCEYKAALKTTLIRHIASKHSKVTKKSN